jgi:hypothetical protein
MTQTDIVKNIMSRFHSNWTSTPLSRVDFPNSSFVGDNTSPWLQVRVNFGIARNAMIASTSLTSRVNGTIIANVFLPLKTGIGQGMLMSESLKAIFHNEQFNRIQCLAGTIVELGNRKSGGDPVEYYQFRVSIPFYAYIN